MKRLTDRIKRPGPAAGLTLALIFLTALAVGGCGPRSASLADPTAPHPGYQRRIMLVLERSDFRPVAGAEVQIEVESPTRLVSPAEGRGRTNAQGGLEMIFEPVAHYDQAAARGGDVVVDFPVRAKLTITGAGRTIVRHLNDRETFARYADPLYQGLSRDPANDLTYYNITAP